MRNLNSTPVLAQLLSVILGYFNDQFQDMSRETWEKQYDFVIVGAGSAGSVLASRLSENPSTRVLLLEAGGRENFVSEVPLAAALLQKSGLDWGYKTVPQKNACLAMKDQRSTWPRGKVLGGCSTINYMLYVRGNQRDYDQWAANGCTGWSWNEVFPYFMKSEDYTGTSYADSIYHTNGGYLTVSDAIVQSPLSQAFIQSGKHIGYPIGDYNGERQAVFGYVQGTIRDGKRCSVSKAFLKPASKRPNLHIVTHALVTRILFSPSNPTEVIGVEFRRKFDSYQVFARQEVIVSGGAVNSPQLLMLSGIGPAHHLSALNIPIVADLPVGENLQDHWFSTIMFTTRNGSSIKKETVVNVDSVMNFLVDNKGPLASLGGVEAFGFIKTNFTNWNDDWPDYQIHMLPTSPSTGAAIFRKIQDLTDDFATKVLDPNAELDTMSLFPVMLRPKGRGTIRLSTTNPTDMPLIDPKYFSHKEDLDSMVEALKICLSLGQAPPLKRFRAEPFRTIVPSCEGYRLYSDEYLACLARSYTATLYHPVGTCRMGPEEDPRTVVDPQLRVKGIQRLRVVDASIMPTIVSGNTNVPVIMIAEKASDIIKGSY